MHANSEKLATNGADSAVKAILNEFVAHPDDEASITQKLTTLCCDELGATWEALSVLDRMQQSQSLSPELSRRVKLHLSEIAFNASGVYLGVSPDIPKPAEPKNTAMEVLSVDDRQIDQSDVAVLDAAIKRTPETKPVDVVCAGTPLFDRYLIVEPVAVGSVCDTFMAMDKQIAALPQAESNVLLRCLHGQTSDTLEATAALQNEFALLQRIAHRSIAKAYNFIETPDLRAIVFAYGSGQFLDHVLESIAPRRLAYAHVLTLIREVSLALAHAHARGVIHGQLHTGNIFITTGGGIRIYDFGHADYWAAPTMQHMADTRVRNFVSPQRARSFIATASDDLYSLACIARELFAGQHTDGSESGFDSEQNLAAIERGLSNDAQSRGNDVRAWLQTFDLRNATFQLPPLAKLVEQARCA